MLLWLKGWIYSVAGEFLRSLALNYRAASKLGFNDANGP